MNEMIMSTMVQDLTPLSENVCKHCDNPVPRTFSKEFCCHGCETAYGLINDFNLEQYYSFNKRRLKPATPSENFDYDIYDDPIFQKNFCKLDESTLQMSCYLFLNNLDCYACSWVCEKAIKKLDPKAKVFINLSSSSATILFDPNKTKLSAIVKLLCELGYPPSPNQDHRKNNHSDILRVGVAFFCFMNIMLLATAEYLSDDLTGDFFDLFRYIAMGLATICLAYSGIPFYINTLKALKRRHLHLDLPITIALISTFAYSSYHAILGQGPIYFDSLSAIVFLLLIGRLVQNIALKKSERSHISEQRSESSHVRCLNEDGMEDAVIPLSKIKKGDILKILPGDIVPVKGRIFSGEAEYNLEFMTGESRWRHVKAEQVIPSGALVGTFPVTISAEEDYLASYMETIQQSSQSLMKQKGHYLTLSQHMANFLILFILGISASIFIYFFWSENLDIAFQRSITTLLIACPCAFGLGAPLIMARAFELGIRKGLIFKSQRAIEKMPLIKKVFFDKTGTLTVAEPKASPLTIDSHLISQSQLMDICKQLHNFSSHHVPQALYGWAQQETQLQETKGMENVQEVFGEGLSFTYNNKPFKLGRARWAGVPQIEKAQVYLSAKGQCLASFRIQEQIQQGANKLLDFLCSIKIPFAILSGDSDLRVQELGHKLGMIQMKGSLSPEDKKKALEKEEGLAMMVGNGINDSLALASAPLSVAVKGSSQLAQKSADLLLRSNDLSILISAFKISKSCRLALVKGFSFAIAFNLLGISLGALGFLTPVVAAILMPISSLTVVYISTSWEA